MADFPDGYYWAKHDEDFTHFIVLIENGLIYAPGLEHPLEGFDPVKQIVCPVKRTDY